MPSDSMTFIRPAREAEYDALLAWLNAAFGKRDAAFFQEHYAHTLGERASIAETSFVIEENGRYLAHVGVYPIDLKTSIGVMPIMGIGQVAVDAEARGRGMATWMMKKTHEIALSRGKVACFLGGNRSLYARFGYEICGIQYEWAWDKWRFSGRHPLKKVETGDDLERLYCQWSGRRYGVAWSRDVFARVISRPGWEHWLGAAGEPAFASVKREAAHLFVDVCAGDEGILPTMMNALSDHYGMPVYLRHCAGNRPLHSIMEQAGMDISRRMQGMIKILNAGAIMERLRDHDGSCAAMEKLKQISGRECLADPGNLRLQKEATRVVFGDPFDTLVPEMSIWWDLERISYI